MRVRRLLLPFLLALPACGDRQPIAATTPSRQHPALAPQLHDFGRIPHGKAAQHDFVIDTRAVADDLVCLGVRADCSCARHRMYLRAADGSEREISGQPFADNAARPGEQLLIRMQIDTAQKDAVDLPPAQSRATVVLQHVGDPDPDRRLYVELNLRFSIDSPVRLRPFAMLQFEDVPVSLPKTVETWLYSDLPGRPVKFGPVQCDDPRLQLRLEPDGDATALRGTFTPEPGKPPGVFKALVRIGTDLPDGYEVHLAAIGKVIPDLTADPMPKLSLGEFDFAHAGREHYVNVRDNDLRRQPGFVVARIVDAAGRDVAERFAVRIEPIDGDPRGARVYVCCRGGLEPPAFRGELLLAKDAANGPFLPIELVAFHRRLP